MEDEVVTPAATRRGNAVEDGPAVSEGRIIRIKCPNLSCGRILAVPERARGKLVRCRGCLKTIAVPLPATPPRGSSDAAEAREPTA